MDYVESRWKIGFFFRFGDQTKSTVPQKLFPLSQASRTFPAGSGSLSSNPNKSNSTVSKAREQRGKRSGKHDDSGETVQGGREREGHAEEEEERGKKRK